MMIADIDVVNGQKVAEETEKLGGKAVAFKTDVTDFVCVTSMVEKTLDEFGKIDVLVNNVGYSVPMPFRKMSRELMEKKVSLNLWSVFNCTRATVDHMIQQRSGNIVNIGSDISFPGGALVSVYAGCKGAVISFSKSMARELGRYGIRVNVVCPATTLPENPEHISDSSMWQGMLSTEVMTQLVERETKLTPLGRLGRPEDIANATVFLASDAASFITGQTLSVDGGWIMP